MATHDFAHDMIMTSGAGCRLRKHRQVSRLTIQNPQWPLWSCFSEDVCVTVKGYIKEAECAASFFLCCRPPQQKSHNNQPGEVLEKQLCR